MNKVYGKIGFMISKEIDPINDPGVYGDFSEERTYLMEVKRNNANWNTTQNTNDEFSINCSFSVLADPFIEKNCQKIKYIEYLGEMWKVKSIEPSYPRITINIGGVYNAEQNSSATET